MGGRTAPSRSISLPRPIAQIELDRHLPGKLGPAIVDVAVGGDQVERAVVVRVEESDPEPEDVTARDSQSDRRGPVGEEPVAQVLEKTWWTRCRSWSPPDRDARHRPGRRKPRPSLPGSFPRRWRRPRRIVRFPGSGSPPGCETSNWRSCRSRRKDRCVRRRRGRPPGRRALDRSSQRCPPRCVTSTNRPPSLRNRWSGRASKSSGRQR